MQTNSIRLHVPRSRREIADDVDRLARECRCNDLVFAAYLLDIAKLDLTDRTQ